MRLIFLEFQKTVLNSLKDISFPFGISLKRVFENNIVYAEWDVWPFRLELLSFERALKLS